MEQKNKSLTNRIFFLIVSIFLLFTIFIPSISLDKYVEYDFNYDYYNAEYESHIDPIATNISPFMFISTLFSNRLDLSDASDKFKIKKQELTTALTKGEISDYEYEKELAKAKETNSYYSYSLYYGHVEELGRFKDKMFLFAVSMLIFYSICLLMTIFNIVNLIKEHRVLRMANVFVACALIVIYLLVQFFTFSFAISASNNIEGFSGKIVEEITIAATPKTTVIVVFIILIAYTIIAFVHDKREATIEKRNREIPIEISNKIIYNQKNRYRKIYSKKSKYKHGYKKKRKK